MTTKDRIWAPWRIDYIKRPKEKGCFLCRILRERKDGKNFVVLRTQKAISLLNTYPYNNGHIMVVPRRHTRDLERLGPDEIQEIFSHTKKIIKALKKFLKPAGFNIGINLGKPAGAGLASHVHLHIVPRWEGDTNFMPTLANTKVLCQSLKATQREIRRHL